MFEDQYDKFEQSRRNATVNVSIDPEIRRKRELALARSKGNVIGSASGSLDRFTFGIGEPFVASKAGDPYGRFSIHGLAGFVAFDGIEVPPGVEQIDFESQHDLLGFTRSQFVGEEQDAAGMNVFGYGLDVLGVVNTPNSSQEKLMQNDIVGWEAPHVDAVSRDYQYRMAPAASRSFVPAPGKHSATIRRMNYNDISGIFANVASNMFKRNPDGTFERSINLLAPGSSTLVDGLQREIKEMVLACAFYGVLALVRSGLIRPLDANAAVPLFLNRPNPDGALLQQLQLQMGLTDARLENTDLTSHVVEYVCGASAGRLRQDHYFLKPTDDDRTYDIFGTLVEINKSPVRQLSEVQSRSRTELFHSYHKVQHAIDALFLGRVTRHSAPNTVLSLLVL